MGVSINTFMQLCFILCIIKLCESKRRCNEVLCASVVSKCMLTQACKCDINMDPEKCTCCVDCAKCLGQYYLRCCSCLDMCNPESLNIDPNDSQVGEYSNPFIELFEALTESKEPLVDGTVISYPAELAFDELSQRLNKHTYNTEENHWHDTLKPFTRMGINCTVVFMSQCHSSAKCREQCQNIGSGSYRYFFNGCCECIGPTCLNYGINESRCQKCSGFDDDYYEYEYFTDEGHTNEIDKDFSD